MKAIFQGRNGLSNSIKNEDDKYSVGYLIDPFREWGFLKPAYAGTTITPTPAWDKYVVDMASSGNAKLVLTQDHIWNVNDVHNTATPVHDMPDGGAYEVYSLQAYQTKIGGTLNSYSTFYFYGGTAGLYDGTNYIDNWMATVPAGASSLGTFSIPYVWQNFLMIGYVTASNYYIAKFDGTLGDNGTLTPTWFELGSNWSVQSFFTYYNYLGVVIYNTYSYESQILLLDGSSTTLPVKRITTSDVIYNSVNINNDLVFLTSDGLKQLGDNGLEPIKSLTSESSSSIATLVSLGISHSDILNNKIYFGSTTNIGGFGKKEGNPYIIYQPYDTAGVQIVKIKNFNTKLYVSSIKADGSYILQYFSTGNAVATLKYPFKDIGQKGIVKYVKFYFKPLASGDAITLGLDTDYGTATTLGTATYATDGAITSKRFEIKKQCHAFRPTVSWTAGGASISHVVVEYEPVSDI